MKWKIIILVVIVLLLGVATTCFFHVRRVFYFAECVADITLVKDKVVKQKPVYPTKLVSVDPNQMGAEIAVKFPDRGSVSFHGRKDEMIKGLGYFIYEIQPDQVKINVPFPEVGWRLEWK